MSREDRVTDTHPSFGKAILNRVSSTPGVSLFDSEIRHERYVTLEFVGAERTRDLNRDWIHGRGRKLSVAMSESQWAALVSSFHNGDGVPVTLTYTQDDGDIEPPPYDPRLALSVAETRGATARAFARIAEAVAAVEEKPTKANVRALRLAVDQAPANVAYAARTLTEHVENVVTKAKHDIEATAVAAAERHGLAIDPSTATAPLALGPSSEEDTP